MRVGAFLLALAWFSGSAYAGYRLTDRSFAWLDDPGALPPAFVTKEETVIIDIGALKGKTPAELRAMASQLSPQQLLCLRASIAPDRVSAVLAGNFTAQEEAALRSCLE